MLWNPYADSVAFHRNPEIRAFMRMDPVSSGATATYFSATLKRIYGPDHAALAEQAAERMAAAVSPEAIYAQTQAQYAYDATPFWKASRRQRWCCTGRRARTSILR